MTTATIENSVEENSIVKEDAWAWYMVDSDGYWVYYRSYTLCCSGRVQEACRGHRQNRTTTKSKAILGQESLSSTSQMEQTTLHEHATEQHFPTPVQNVLL